MKPSAEAQEFGGCDLTRNVNTAMSNSIRLTTKSNQTVIFMNVEMREKKVNTAMKAVVAGFVSGIIAPLSVMETEPARRLNLDAIKRATASPAQAWRTVGNNLRVAMRNHETASSSKSS
jgi:predicted nuclease with RNAse H fold